jgi:hypothetical protein
LARPSIDPAQDALHAIERGAVQRLLEVGGLKCWAQTRSESYAATPFALVWRILKLLIRSLERTTQNCFAILLGLRGVLSLPVI